MDAPQTDHSLGAPERCMLCFSVDRTLSTLARGLCHALGLAVALPPERPLRACWECGATLVRLHRFKQRAVRALVLLSSARSIAELKCVSQLSRSSMIVIDFNSKSLEPTNPKSCPSPAIDCLLNSEIDDEIKIEIDEDFEKLPQCNAWVESVDLKNDIPLETATMTDIKVLKEHIDKVEGVQMYSLGTCSDDGNFDATDHNISDNDEKVGDIKADCEEYNDRNEEPAEANNKRLKRKSVTGVKKATAKKEEDKRRTRVIGSAADNPPELPSLIQEGKLEEFIGNDEQMQKARKDMAAMLPRKLRCRSCLERFPGKETLRVHTLERHSEVAGPHACDICGLRFAAPDALAEHRASHYRLYRCRNAAHARCDFVSPSPGLSVYHARSRVPSGPNKKWDPEHQLIKLIECKKVEKFIGTTQEVLKAHRILLNIMKISKRDPFHCPPCAVAFTSRPELDRHNRLCHSPAAGPHVCDICGSRFTEIALLSAHANSHYTLYRCRHGSHPDCDFVCPVPARVVCHVRQHDRFKNRECRKQDTKCKLCGGVFRTRGYFMQHMRMHNSKSFYECDACGKSYNTRAQINRHIKDHAMRYMCETCGKRCPSNSALKAHSLAHMDPALRRFECHECNQKFISRPKLLAHLAYHSGERPHKCADCGRDYAEPYALTLHRRLAHGGEQRRRKYARTKSAHRNAPTRSFLPGPREKKSKSVDCSVCGKTFKDRFTLRVHFSIHSDARPYKCDQCDKSFKVYPGLYRHKFLHKGIKPYQCNVCGSAFASKQGLTTHEVVHSDDKPHGCNICHKKFKYQSNLWKHLKTHNVVVKNPVVRA